MASIHSVVSTSRSVRSHSGSGTRKSASSRVFSASSESAAASRRRSISIATERASVSTTSRARRRLASGTKRSNSRAAKRIACSSRANCSRTPGRITLTATSRPPAASARRAWCTCAIEAAAIGSLKLANRRSSGRPSAISTILTASGARERRHAVLEPLEVARDGDADDVGPRRQELAELDVGRAEPRQRRREPGGAVAEVAALDQPRQAQEAAPGRRQHARIDERERALARQHGAGADVAPEMEKVAQHDVKSSSPDGARRRRR